MRNVLIYFLSVILLFGVLQVRAQELSVDVFHSEDEILESLQLDDLSFDSYLMMHELSYLKIGFGNNHQFDLVPNLSSFGVYQDSLASTLEHEQLLPFIPDNNKANSSNKLSGFIKYNYTTELKEESDYRFLNQVGLSYDQKHVLNLSIKREMSGRERIVYRSLDFNFDDRFINRISLGNFSRRYSLGLVVGHRGKLFSYSRKLNYESFLFPDYGGQNGLAVKLESKNFNGELLTGHYRDEVHTMTTTAGYFEIESSLRPTIVIAYNKIRNRTSNVVYNDFKSSAFFNYKYKNGYSFFEIARQFDKSNNSNAFIATGRHRFNQAVIKYSTWYYGKEYVDLSGGSKYGSISNSEIIEDVDFELNNRRSGQIGGMFKTTVQFSDEIDLSNALIVSSRNSDSTYTQFYSELAYELNKSTTISLDYLVRHRNYRNTSDGEIESQQLRSELKYYSLSLYLRSYIGYNKRSGKDDFLSWFFNTRWNTKKSGRWQVWLNVGRIATDISKINYIYGYIENEFNLLKSLAGSFKLSHRYNRNHTERNRSQLTLELKYIL